MKRRLDLVLRAAAMFALCVGLALMAAPRAQAMEPLCPTAVTPDQDAVFHAELLDAPVFTELLDAQHELDAHAVAGDAIAFAHVTPREYLELQNVLQQRDGALAALDAIALPDPIRLQLRDYVTQFARHAYRDILGERSDRLLMATAWRPDRVSPTRQLR